MQNVSRAFIMAFSMIAFVVGFSYAMYLINNITTTSKTLLEDVTTTQYYDTIQISGDDTDKRTVGVETIVPVLYRYFDESYIVRIENKEHDLIHLFDSELEDRMTDLAGDTDIESAKLDEQTEALKYSIYNNPENSAYLFMAPWKGNKEYAKIRVDYFLEGTNGYIGNALVEYGKTITGTGNQKGFLEVYGGDTFEESFVEYAYKGETISTEDGIETITGSTQEKSKVMIVYRDLDR